MLNGSIILYTQTDESPFPFSADIIAQGCTGYEKIWVSGIESGSSGNISDNSYPELRGSRSPGYWQVPGLRLIRLGLSEILEVQKET